MARFQSGETFADYSLRVYGQSQQSQFQVAEQIGYKWVNDANSTPRSYHEGNNAYGDYYNFFAASAESGTYSMSSGNATDSLCPKGWQLPPLSGNKSWNNLLVDAYNLQNNESGSTAVRKATIDMPYSGRIWDGNGNIFSRGIGGDWWSAGVSENLGKARELGIGQTVLLSPQSNDNTKAIGFTVRCVKR